MNLRPILSALAAALACAAPAMATITYHVRLDMPAEYRNEELFVHFSILGDPSSPSDQVGINNFQTDASHYHFDPSVGVVHNAFPGNVVLVDQDGQDWPTYTERMTFGTYMAFDVLLRGGQFEGTTPVSPGGYQEFQLTINRDASHNWESILPNGENFGTLEIYRDGNNPAAGLIVDANAALTVTSAPAPEPATLAALALPVPALARRRRRPA